MRIARWPLHLGAVRDGMFWHMLSIIACLAPTGAHAIYFQSVCVCVLSFSRRTFFAVRRAFRVPSFVLAAFSFFIATGEFFCTCLMHLMWRWCTPTLIDNERNAIWCFLKKIIQCYDFARTWIETSIFNEAWKVWEDQQFGFFVGVGWHMLSIFSQLVLGTRRPIANSMHLFVGCGCPVSPQPGVWQMQFWLRLLDFKKAVDSVEKIHMCMF